jgi:hypothetical protein
MTCGYRSSIQSANREGLLRLKVSEMPGAGLRVELYVIPLQQVGLAS